MAGRTRGITYALPPLLPLVVGEGIQRQHHPFETPNHRHGSGTVSGKVTSVNGIEDAAHEDACLLLVRLVHGPTVVLLQPARISVSRPCSSACGGRVQPDVTVGGG